LLFFIKDGGVVEYDELNNNCSKNVFEGEEYFIINSELEKAKRDNLEKKWDFYGRPLFRSSMIYESEA
jgi:hypothetical protein